MLPTKTGSTICARAPHLASPCVHEAYTLCKARDSEVSAPARHPAYYVARLVCVVLPSQATILGCLPARGPPQGTREGACLYVPYLR